MRIGFIGTGVMGNAIAQNLIKAGYDLIVNNRTKSKTDNLVAMGAKWADTPKEVTQNSDIVFTMLGYPSEVQDVYFGDNGIFEGVSRASILVDMTTSTPKLAREIASTAHKYKCLVLDAPVSGGDIGAKNGTLTVMVGGNEQLYNSLKDIFASFSSSTHYFGEAGSGQNAKMANQIMVAGTMTGLTEMLVYAKKSGLDLSEVLKTVGSGAAANWSLDNYGPRILANDYTPGFFAKHFLKDLKIALDEAHRLGVDLPATQQAEKLYEDMVDVKHLGDEGTQGLINIY